MFDPAFTAELPLNGGGAITLRPLMPEDDGAYRIFAAALSPEAIYYRFFSPRNTLTEQEIEHFLNLDYHERFAVVAVDGDKIVGVGRYDQSRHEPFDAEIAFIVAEDHQGNGIATEMLRLLALAARQNGITRFVASVLPDNHKMLQVFAESGWIVDRHFEDGVIQIALAITPSETDQPQR